MQTAEAIAVILLILSLLLLIYDVVRLVFEGMKMICERDIMGEYKDKT